jgi:hypothetical protein
VPVAIDGSRRAWSKGSRRVRRADVRIAFGRPLRWTGSGGRVEEQAFAERVMAAVAETLTTIPRRGIAGR